MQTGCTGIVNSFRMSNGRGWRVLVTRTLAGYRHVLSCIAEQLTLCHNDAHNTSSVVIRQQA